MPVGPLNSLGKIHKVDLISVTKRLKLLTKSIFFSASSLQESMSIRVPSSRGPKEVVKQPSKNREEIFSKAIDSNLTTQLDDRVKSHQSPSGHTAVSMDSSISSEAAKNGRKSMELAVSSLAKAQQNEIQRLMNQQENDRKELKKLFEQQQRRLIQV